MKLIIVLLSYIILQTQLMYGLTGNQKSERIMNGTITEQEQFPWHAAIAVEKENGVLLCGGSLISNQWIVTAAQCVDGALSYSIGLGKKNLDSYETSDLIVSHVGIQHQMYNNVTQANNIALIKLPAPIFFSERINKTMLANWKTNVTKDVFIAGFGKSEYDEEISPQQTYLELEGISNERCKNYYDQIITHLTMCAKPYSKNQGVCNNDFGGGLVQNLLNETIQVGVFSFYHTEGCDQGSPFVFTRVALYINWINNKTGLDLDNGNNSSPLQTTTNQFLIYLISVIFLFVLLI